MRGELFDTIERELERTKRKVGAYLNGWVTKQLEKNLEKALDRKTFTTPEVVRLCGVGRTRLHGWMERGYITASFPGGGAGFAHKWTLEDVVRVLLFVYLTEDLGMKRKNAAEILGEGGSK